MNLKPPPPLGSMLKREKNKQKATHGRQHDEAHLNFLRSLPCLVTLAPPPSEACHVRYADDEFGKEETGRGVKPDDMWALPLSSAVHKMQHSMGERQFWSELGINPLIVCQRLWLCSGDLIAGMRIITSTFGRIKR